jgi:hypothetical protein
LVFAAMAKVDAELKSNQLYMPDLMITDMMTSLIKNKGYSIIVSNKANTLKGIGQGVASKKLTALSPTMVYVGIHAPWMYLPGENGYLGLMGDVVVVSNSAVVNTYRIVIQQQLSKNISGLKDLLDNDRRVLNQNIQAMEKDLVDSLLETVF